MSKRAADLWKGAGREESWLDGDPSVGGPKPVVIDPLESSKHIVLELFKCERLGWYKRKGQWEVVFILEQSTYHTGYWVCTNAKQQYLVLRKPGQLVDSPPLSELSVREVIRKVLSALEHKFQETALFKRREVMTECRTVGFWGQSTSQFEMCKIDDYHVDTANQIIDGVWISSHGCEADRDLPFRQLDSKRRILTYLFESETLDDIGLDVPSVKRSTETQSRRWFRELNQLEWENLKLRKKMKSPKRLQLERWRSAAEQKPHLEELLRSADKDAIARESVLEKMASDKGELTRRINALNNAVHTLSAQLAAMETGGIGPSRMTSVDTFADSMMAADEEKARELLSKLHIESTRKTLAEDQLREYEEQLSGLRAERSQVDAESKLETERLKLELSEEQKRRECAEDIMRKDKASARRLSRTIDLGNAAFAREVLESQQSKRENERLHKELRELRIRFGMDPSPVPPTDEDEDDDDDEDASISDLEDLEVKKKKEHMRKMTRDEIEFALSTAIDESVIQETDMSNYLTDLEIMRVKLGGCEQKLDWFRRLLKKLEQDTGIQKADIEAGICIDSLLAILATVEDDTIEVEALETGAYSDEDGGVESADATEETSIGKQLRKSHEALQRMRDEKLELQSALDFHQSEISELKNEMEELRLGSAEPLFAPPKAGGGGKASVERHMSEHGLEVISPEDAEAMRLQMPAELREKSRAELIMYVSAISLEHVEKQSELEDLRLRVSKTQKTSEELKQQSQHCCELSQECAALRTRVDALQKALQQIKEQVPAAADGVTKEQLQASLSAAEAQRSDLHTQLKQLARASRMSTVSPSPVPALSAAMSLSDDSSGAVGLSPKTLPSKQKVVEMYEELVSRKHSALHCTLKAKLSLKHAADGGNEHFDVYMAYLGHQLLYDVLIMAFSSMEDRLFLFARCMVEILQISEAKAERLVRSQLSGDWMKYVANTHVIGGPLDPELGELRSAAELRLGAAGMQQLDASGLRVTAALPMVSATDDRSSEDASESNYNDDTLLDVRFSRSSIEETIGNICDSVNDKYDTWDFLGDPSLRRELESFCALCCEVSWALVLSSFELFPRITQMTHEEMETNPVAVDLEVFQKCSNYLPGSVRDSENIVYYALPGLIVSDNVVLPATVFAHTNEDIGNYLFGDGIDDVSPLIKRETVVAEDIDEWEPVGYSTAVASPQTAELNFDFVDDMSPIADSEDDESHSVEEKTPPKERRKSKLVGVGEVDDQGAVDAIQQSTELPPTADLGTSVDESREPPDSEH